MPKERTANTKQRRTWTADEHQRFLEAIDLYNRDWKRIQAYVKSKTVPQLRSHAQKHFLREAKKEKMAIEAQDGDKDEDEDINPSQSLDFQKPANPGTMKRTREPEHVTLPPIPQFEIHATTSQVPSFQTLPDFHFGFSEDVPSMMDIHNYKPRRGSVSEKLLCVDFQAPTNFLVSPQSSSPRELANSTLQMSVLNLNSIDHQPIQSDRIFGTTSTSVEERPTAATVTTPQRQTSAIVRKNLTDAYLVYDALARASMLPGALPSAESSLFVKLDDFFHTVEHAFSGLLAGLSLDDQNSLQTVLGRITPRDHECQ